MAKHRHAKHQPRPASAPAAALDAAAAAVALRRGLAAFQTGDYPEAIQSWQRARRGGTGSSLDSALAEAHFRRALAMPDPARRAQELREAVALAPDRASYHVHLGDAYRRQGQRQRALAAYTAAHARAPANARIARALALALLADPAAGPVAQELLDQVPTRDEATTRLRALAHLRANDPSAAIAILAARKPPSPFLALALGLAEMAAGQPAAAAAAFASVQRSRLPAADVARRAAAAAILEAHRRAGALDAAVAALARLDVPTAAAPRRAYAAACRRLAVDLMLDERIEEALAVGQRAQTADPGDAATRRGLAHLREIAGMLAARRGDLARAAEHWQAALPDQPASLRLLRNLALVEERLERWQPAAAHWAELLRLWGKELAGRRRGDPAAAELRQRLLVVQRHLAGLYAAGGDLREAIRTFERVLAVEPDDAELRLRVGELCLENEDWSRAIDHLRRALANRPDDVRILIELGSACDLKGDDRAALAYLEQARALEPGNRAADEALASVQHGRGHRLADQGRRDEAVTAFAAAAALAPTNPENWECLGGAYLWLDRRADARSAFDRARALAPKDPLVRISIGQQYLDAGDRKEAEKQFREAVRLDRGPLMRTTIGLMYARLGDMAAASPYLKPALKDDAVLPLMQIGKALVELRHEAEAIPYAERAAALAPWDVDAHINLAFALAFSRRDPDRAAAELSVAEVLARARDDRDGLAVIAEGRKALQVLWEDAQRPGGLGWLASRPVRGRA